MLRNSFIKRFSKKRLSVSKDCHTELSKAILKYRECREELIASINETIRLFDEFSIEHIPEIIESFDRKSLINLKTELGERSGPKLKDMLEIKAIISLENPIIIVLGQLKTGKSTFTNILLRKNVVPQSFEVCTSRVTRISFSESNFIELVDPSGRVIEKKMFKNHKSVLLKYIKLNASERQNPDEMNKTVKIGLKNKFLESGIDIIDSPGMETFDYLKFLSKHMVKNVLPVVIYVIDGRAGVKQTDTADLLELISICPNIEIIYFITHLDEEDLDLENEDPITISQRKMELSFRKLQYHNFIPSSYKTYSKCPYFHGASLKRLIEASQKQSNPEINYHFEEFKKFQKDFENILTIYFKKKIFESCEILMDFQMDMSTKIISQAENFKSKTKKNIEQIKQIKKIEKEMYFKIKMAISDSKSDLINRLINRLKSQSKEIINPIIDTIYPNSIQIPENGIVNDPVIVDQCQGTIIKILIQGLENLLKTFVEEELFQNYQNAVKDKIFKSIKDIRDSYAYPINGKTSYLISLERLLSRNYKLDRLSSVSTQGNQSVVFEFMNVVLSSVKTFLSNGLFVELNENEVNVKNPEWKLTMAKEYLKKCDHHLLAEDICKSLFEDFEIKHITFKRNIISESNFIKKEVVALEKIRTKILNNAPRFYPLFLNIANIEGKYKFEDISRTNIIGKGAQSEVFKGMYNDTEIAIKEIKLIVYTLDNIAKEVFHSHRFSHENIMTILGISKSDDEKSIQIIYPLMKLNLRDYINYNVISRKNKTKVALEIAEGLHYLHEQDVIHQDLKLPNILINKNDSVCISDYGFCKSMIIAHYNNMIPIHVAPEVKKNELTKKIDIYSYGILLWYLFEGSGREPNGAILLKLHNQVVWDNSLIEYGVQMTPEKVNKFPNKIWNLMSECWSVHPDDRPDTDAIIHELQSFE